MFTLYNFFRSKQWVNFLKVLKSERVNEEGFIVCEHCGETITKAYDCIGHHVIELTEENVNDYDISLNEENVKLVHHRCHNIIHDRFGHEMSRRVYIVYGSPCAGKHEYVNEIAGKNDLVLDLDSIYAALSTNKRYCNSKRLSRNVFAVRDCILDMIKTRTGKWNKAFVIGGYPFARERESLAETLGAEIIYIDSTLEECLIKCEEERRGQEEYIKKWFDSYIE